MNPDGDELLRLYGILQDASPADEPTALATFSEAVARIAKKLGGSLEAEHKIKAATQVKWSAQQRMEAKRKIPGVRS